MRASQASGAEPGPPASSLPAVNGGQDRPPPLAVLTEQDPPQGEQGLGLAAGHGNDEPPVSASSHASQASGEDSGPPESTLPAVNGDECRPRLPAFDQQRIATMRGLIAGVEETVEALQAVACELRALSERLGGASRPTGREGPALENQAQAILNVATLSIAMAEERWPSPYVHHYY